MFVVIVEFELNPGCSDAFRERVCQQARDSLSLEADCHVFDVCLDPQHTDRVLLYEVYSDRAAFDTHLASAHFRQFDSDVGAWVSARQVRFYDRV